MMNNLAVEVSQLRVQRGKTSVFDGIDLAIPRGQITGLLGPSGCGKTTLMRSIVGVQRITSGEVTVLGEPGGSRQLRHRVSYGTQGAAVYGDLSVRQNLSYFAALLKAPKGDVDRVIAEVGLGPQAGQLVDSLSGGQSTRVSLAMALIGSPELVVLDEPTVGLDPVLRSELWGLFRGLADRGVTLIVSSHVMDEALRCDRLLLLREGRIIADTTPHALLADTGTDDPEAAFLALIERDRSLSGDTRRSRREARADDGEASA
ncbi:ABC transporter ATP-binding protein [Microbacterium saperdae]|uniref:ABC-2 type transport system ATP-binding protein n=1 Tax=Microbacterium saperdae TaxID=69368 RepID=A0A543BCF6_9MICO|nr:ABC transporter ATP-binding protein [Microbacterium saperdae]TQL82525.1 ABC-2 type transport system ATP-binding protein [Microbacterium saperdae]GGM40612.1 multidrug ABC transporter ATP-binding protein [Microbacterium saperdae]